MPTTSKPPTVPTTDVVQHAPIRPQSFMELERFANMAAKSNFVPKDYQGRPDNIMVAIQMGSEVGLAPMQSLQNIAVINGRPALWGDAMLGLVMASPYFEDIQETTEGDGDKRVAKCLVRRRGRSPVMRSFSVEDAKLAGLWDKKGAQGQPTPWVTYPARMLAMRARGFALRDQFPDVLKGLIAAEEARDMPDRTILGTAEEVPTPEAPKAPPAVATPKPSLAPEKPREAAQAAPAGSNGPDGNKVTLDTWIKNTHEALSRAATEPEAVAILVQRLTPWNATQVEKLAAAPAWTTFWNARRDGLALNAAVTELLAEKSREENQP